MFYACLGPFVIFMQCQMYWLMLVLLLTRSAYRSNQFPTLVRPVWCLQEVKTVRLVVRTDQTGIVLLPVLFHSLVCYLWPYALHIPV
jgi:hypothetical protein